MSSKKFLLFLIILSILSLNSCGPEVPKKELEDAKTALERAKNAEAHIYAETEFKDAENDYITANKFVAENKNKEAKDKAISSKLKSDKSYETARKAKASKLIEAINNLAGQILIDRILEEDLNEYKKLKEDIDSINNVFSKGDYDHINKNAPELEKKIREFINIINKKFFERLYETVSNKIEKAKENKLNIIFPDKFSTIENDYNNIKDIANKQDFITAINNSSNIILQIDNLYNELSIKKEEAKNLLIKVQDKYESAKNNNLVIDYALEELQKALPYINNAKNTIDSNPIESINNSKNAEKIINEAINIANEKYKKYVEKKREEEKLLELERQKEIEEQKKRALEYIEQAKERLQKLKSKKKSILPELKFKEFCNITPEFIRVGEFKEIGTIEEEINKKDNNTTVSKPTDYKTKQIKKVSDENITIDMVEEYLKLAEEAFANEEYLDAIDYARESIRMADILLAMEEFQIYIVKLNPANRDCLWKISGYMYKNKTWLWPIIWRANKYQIKDPDLIYPGQELKIPPTFVK